MLGHFLMNMLKKYLATLAVLMLSSCGGGDINERESALARTVADTSAPTITIGALGAISATGAIKISGSAGDNKAVRSVTWTNSLGGAGTAVLSGKTTSVTWTATNVQLYTGSNAITFTAEDTSGNKKSVTTMVAYSSTDTTPPQITYQSQSNYTPTTVTLTGSATDNIVVASVNWSNNTMNSTTTPVAGQATLTGGPLSVTWTAVVTVTSGSNVVSLTARDAAGNLKSTQVTVTVTATGSPSFVSSTPYGQFQMPSSGFFKYQPVETLLRGENSDDEVMLPIEPPPGELHPCLGGKIVFNNGGVPVFPTHPFLYNNWWLLASYTPVNEDGYSATLNKKDKAYFYWAWRISETEIGVTSTGASTDQIIEDKKIIDTRINTGFSVLPFQWTSSLWLAGLPLYKDELCK